MRTAPAFVVAALSLLALAGCVPDDDPVIPDPLPSSTPIFGSDEEALAAAEEAFTAYLAVLDQIAADGGSEPERLNEVAGVELVAHEAKAFAILSSNGQRGTGSRLFDSMTIQSTDLDQDNVDEAVIAYACEDYSATDVVDASGTSVVSPSRQLRWPLVVGFEVPQDHRAPLIVSSIEDWTGADFCVAD
jgi:hypothetical protein